jgi:hypothetical protein
MAGPGNPRIPLALQQVFVASQQGAEVTEAPKQGLGFKIFQRFGRTDRVKSVPKHKPKKSVAPSSSSLNSERSGSTRETAADATRKAMKKKEESGKTDFLVSLF